MRIIALSLGAALLAGCATKHYGRMGELTPMERDTLTCREIALDRARTQGFIEKVNKDSQFDDKDVLALLGDLGIGNAMEKDAALKSANARMNQLDALATAKSCAAV